MCIRDRYRERWKQHISRMDSDRFPKVDLLCQPKGKKRPKEEMVRPVQSRNRLNSLRRDEEEEGKNTTLRVFQNQVKTRESNAPTRNCVNLYEQENGLFDQSLTQSVY